MAEKKIGNRYRLSRKILPGDPIRGVPELWTAHDGGDVYYIKLWKRRGDDRSDVRALWNREVRGLTRLQGYPGASELFVRLHDLSADEQQYYAVLDGGRRVLLSELLRDRARTPWLLNLSEAGRRRPIWEGILRIAEAISILHGEGTLHRALSAQSVFVGPDGEGDFRLSGFEWTIRVAGGGGPAPSVASKSGLMAPELARSDPEYSTATDWFDLGLLAAEVLGASTGRLKKLENLRSSIDDFRALRVGEKELIQKLISDSPSERAGSSDEVLREIRNIVRDLSVASAGPGRPLVLALRLQSDLNISKAVEIASQGRAPASDPLAQRQWIKDDLRGDLRVTARRASNPVFILRGDRLEYRVKPWKVGDLETWDIGFCESIEAVPATAIDDQTFGLGQRKLEILPFFDVKKTTQKIRDRSAPWNKVFPLGRQKKSLEPHLQDVHDFFRITQQLETAITSAQICQMSVVSITRTANETVLEVTPKDEPERNLLAQHLGLANPSQQLRDWFDLGAESVSADDDNDRKKHTYQFLERRTIDSESSAVEWRFLRASHDPSGVRYFFRCNVSITIRPKVVYLARGYGGTIAQLRRRHEAIEEMRYHENLLRLISDPKGVSRVSGEGLPPARSTIEIDGSKLDALERLWQTQPSFAIQGPPGTGKTTLIQAFADRLFNADPSAQVLITAHSHHTVDDVRGKLKKIFGTLKRDQQPILLRLGAKQQTEHDIRPVTENLLRQLQVSRLAEGAPDDLKRRIKKLLPGDADHGEAAETDLRTMQMLVQDAANVTFATLNSSELADLNDRGRRFDWVVVEEAGKAHGFDMAIALEESHRLLLIGDHFQLPPFNSALYKRLLGDPLRVRNAIQAGFQFSQGLIDTTIVEDRDGREPFINRCENWRRMVDLFATIFQQSAGETLQSPGPAATLTDQHRMHPHIAGLVGRIFYPDADGSTILDSPASTHERFAKAPPFEIAGGSWLPEQRIVWCDVPYKQKREFSEGETEGVFVSQPEIRAVLSVLDEIRSRPGEACEVQILSPYNDQIDALKEALSGARHVGKIGHMFEAPFDLRLHKRQGATVDEFQGSEADIVIVSLVRNNPLPPWVSVGFLKEANRMNVLLSRARHKLIIVGSWEFFATRCDEKTFADAEYAYIGRMMEEMQNSLTAKHLARVSV
ncbi:AAA domain-containing protein [Mesorhizobium sp.]|uniref:AAA domain-containing protein n=1 Tax=Mesorhizobium sp. TaxID=1871066 RepID=UPI000FE62AA6|nr:AAA domain-containing protein [Mesorhizobium sp.]RWD94258.1 MAG: helicase [Mesorhizobium sp.]TIV52680.1 MAG: helicase [Mesorhizobium sp.]